MTTPTLIQVWDTQLNPGGQTAATVIGLPNLVVKLTLNYDGAASSSPIANLAQRTVYSTTTNNVGYWTAFLVPNNKITPTGTLYTVEIEGYRPYNISVSDVAVPGGGWQSSQIVV